MFNFKEFEILAYNNPVDMRKSFNGLLGVIKKEFNKSSLSKTLFVFFNKRKNYIKVLFWDRTGYCIFSKKLERGSFNLSTEEKIEVLNLERLQLILDGIKLGKR